MRWPLFGRDAELRRLAELISDVDARGVVIAGPAGAGKTRLAAECRRVAESSGVATVAVMASVAVQPVPFGALVSLLPRRSSASNGADHRRQMLQTAADALLGLAGGRRLMLLVDDAHLLDDLSATVVHQIATTTRSLVLVTIRAGQPAPAPVTALWKNGVVERFELAGLSPEVVSGLLAEVLGGQIDPGAVARLAERSRGNVLYLRELVEGAVSNGVLRERDGLRRE